jgi:hypothetical protein
MENIKNLVQLILENEYVDAGTAFNGYNVAIPRSAHSDFGVHRDDASQVNRIHAFANSFLAGGYLEPQAALVMLRSKLNHAGLDFDFNRKTKLKEGNNAFQLSRYGEIFGTTPTTNLLKDGFDRGMDYIPLQLTFNLTRSPNGKAYFSNIQIGQTGLIDVANMVDPLAPVEEMFDETGEVLVESKDMVGSLTNMIMKNKEIKTKVLEPIFKSLMVTKKKKKLTKDATISRLKFAAKSAVRKLTNMGKIKKGMADDKIIDKLANSLYRKFRTMETLTGD